MFLSFLGFVKRKSINIIQAQIAQGFHLSTVNLYCLKGKIKELGFSSRLSKFLLYSMTKYHTTLKCKH